MKDAVFEAIKQDIQIALANLDEPVKGLILAGMVSDYIDTTLSVRPKLSNREINSRITDYVKNMLMTMWPSRIALGDTINRYCDEHPATDRALRLLAQLAQHYEDQLKK